MKPIPIYLKTDPNMPRPADPEYYLITGSGTFFGRNHLFYSSESPAKRSPRALAEHRSSCQVRFPKLGVAALEYIVGFFSRIYDQHESESIVLLYWDLRRKRYRLVVPEQEATVWESSSGSRSALDVTYQVPVPAPAGCLLVGDIHCHCDFGAFASYTDEKDEQYRDGIHAIVGRIDREPPEFHLEMAADGCRFGMQFDQWFKGYRRRRTDVPQKWLDRVKVKVNRPQSWTWNDKPQSQGSGYGYGGYGGSKNKYKGWDDGRDY
jgi:hypothetical protein